MSASKDVLRIGIIGFGGSGPAHLWYYPYVPGCKVVKIYDPKEGGMARAKSMAPGIFATQNLDEFWDGLDAVSICSPDSTHADYIVQALEHGLHVICEKPITDSIEGLRKIQAARKKYGKTVSALHQMRFVPVHRVIQKMLREKALGAVSYLEGYYVHDLTKRAFVNDTWRITDNATPMVYCGCHFVDLLRWLASEEVVEVYAAANNIAFPEYPESDTNIVTMKFKSGLIGKVLVVLGSPVHQDHSVRVYGREGVIENNLLFRNHDGWKTIYRPTVFQKEHIRHDKLRRTLKDTVQLFMRNFKFYLLGKIFDWSSFLLGARKNWEYSARFYPVRVYEHSAACIANMTDFVSAIREGREPLCSFDEAAKTVLACLAAVDSYRTGQPVKVKNLEEALR